MGKDMTSFYAQQTVFDLNRLRSQKFNRVSKLRKEAATYLNLQELKKLLEQIKWIDAELACRRDQMSLFE
jgi:hypothetical protein